MTVGIYTILNTQNYKLYIGQSHNIERRLYNHLNNLLNNRHENQHLQNAFNKYAQGTFVFSLIEECSLDNLSEREQFWLDSYRDEDLYNICKFASSNRGYKHSQESIEKIRAASTGNKSALGLIHTEESKAAISRKLKGRPLLEETKIKIRNSSGRQVVQIDKFTGETIRTFESIKSAAAEYGIHTQGIIKVCKNKLRTSGGYIWKYA